MALAKRPTLDGIKAAAQTLSQSMGPSYSPLVLSPLLSEQFGCEVWIKVETINAIGSFKLRGALNALARSEGRSAGPIVTSSTGNHGQGVAWAARRLRRHADIFVPAGANSIKVAKMKLLGATVHEAGIDLDEAKALAKIHAHATHGYFVDDGEDVSVMEGAGTIGLEIASELPSVGSVIIPTGGGNLLGGVAVALKETRATIRVIGVQSDGAAGLHDSFHAGHILSRPVRTNAECLAQRQPADFAFAVVKAFADDIVTVSDEDLSNAAHRLALSAHILSEPGSAAGLAALEHHPRLATQGGPIVIVVTGANVDAAALARILSTRNR